MPEVVRKPDRFQFTLRKLLPATVAIARLLAVFTHRVLEYRRSIASADAITELGETVSWNPELLENLIKDQTVARITDVHFSNPQLSAEQWYALARLLHLFGLQIDGPTFTQAALAALVDAMHLEYLVLFNT
ncbi:MAG: hypothetical protein R3E01_29730 [Pirellulaceae bacterium]